MLIRNLLSSSHIPSLRCFSSSALWLLKVGDTLKQTRTFADEDLVEYAKVTYDSNPIHFDSEAARNAGFEDRLVHGTLVASMIPHIISSHFVSLYVSVGFFVPDFLWFVLFYAIDKKECNMRSQIRFMRRKPDN